MISTCGLGLDNVLEQLLVRTADSVSRLRHGDVWGWGWEAQGQQGAFLGFLAAMIYCCHVVWTNDPRLCGPDREKCRVSLHRSIRSSGSPSDETATTATGCWRLGTAL
jgi:hypothetical protein